PARRPPADGEAAAAAAARPADARRDGEPAAAPTLVGVRGVAADACALAAGAGAPEVDLPAPPGGPAAARTGGAGARPPPCPRESALRVCAHPGRAAQARHPGRGDDDPLAPSRLRAGAGAAPDRPVLGRVSARAGGGDLGGRLLHRPDRLAADA